MSIQNRTNGEKMDISIDYWNKVKLFINLIEKKYKNLDFGLTNDKNLLILTFSIKDKSDDLLVSEYTIYDDTKWKDIKLHIDKFLKIDYTCNICFNDYKKIKNNINKTTCPKCSEPYCVDCYINIFRSNKGIIKCPFCSFEYGSEFPEFMIEAGIEEIKKRIINISNP